MEIDRVVWTGKVGTSAGTKWIDNIPAADDIDIDNDGVMDPAPGFLLDLSHIGSMVLGKQMPMMGRYKLNSLRIGIRHVDDVVDNEEEAAFAGIFEFFPSTDHLENALKLARLVEKSYESTEIDFDSYLLSTERDYSGMRFNWSGNNDVEYPTQSGLGLSQEWSLLDVFAVYNTMLEEKYDNQLWMGRVGIPCRKAWTVSAGSGSHGDDGEPGTSFEYPAHFTDDKLNVGHTIFPLVFGSVQHSSVNEDTAGTVDTGVDDDYHVYVEVDFTFRSGY